MDFIEHQAKSHPDWYKKDCRTRKELVVKLRRWSRRLDPEKSNMIDPDAYFLAKRRLLAMKIVILRRHGLGLYIQ